MSESRLEKLRNEMKRRGIHVWGAHSYDAHESEYTCACDRYIEYLSGFTGDNGHLIVTPDEALLWTDGRYFIQAEAELSGTGIRLMKSGMEGVPSAAEWIEEQGLDPVSYDTGIAEAVWTDRPERPAEPVWILGTEYAGESCPDKLLRIRRKMSDAGISGISVKKLDDITWITNLRGNDIPCNPVFFSYMEIGLTDAVLYMQKASLNDAVREYLADCGIRVQEYGEFRGRYPFSDIVTELKCVKNGTEIRHLRECVLRDSRAVAEFIRAIRTEVSSGTETDELGAARLLESFRKKDDRYLMPSFATIAGYGPHGAIVHYEVTEKSSLPLKPEGFLLVDSGGQYLDGTTDVTRTIALGKLTEEQKLHYTLVMAGMLRLLNAEFEEGEDCGRLNEIVRGPLKEHGLDFRHGAGHGIGFVNCVHEGPVNLKAGFVLKPGMVLSDEPGVYMEGGYGIRIENMLLVVEKRKTAEDGGFSAGTAEKGFPDTGTAEEDPADGACRQRRILGFENLTWVPLEEEAVDFSVMTEEDIRYYQEYQEKAGKAVSSKSDL